VTVLVVGAAAGLYPLWSNWDWHAPDHRRPGGPDVAAMVAQAGASGCGQPIDAQAG